MAQNDKEKSTNNDEEVEKIRSDYGLRANLRLGVMTTVMRIDALEKILSIRYNMSWKRFWIYIGELLAVWATVIIVLSAYTSAFPYIGIWIIAFAGVISILLGYHAFLLPSGGSLFTSVWSYVGGLVKFYAVKLGIISPPRKTKIAKVDKDGIIEFDNGDSGVLLLIDGMTAATAYAKEVKKLESRSRSYQNARNRTTTEFNFTSSQRQDVTEQIRSNKKLKKSTQNKAFKALSNTRIIQLEQDLDGKFSTVVQHKMLREKSLRELYTRLETVQRYSSDGGGLFYAAEPLGKEEVDEFFKTFYSFK
ncbi:hypothetical protein [Staphylococcus saprophyticus]|uniref:hypothetical protein n=1 Tax=Staphylococcus saprophyticus TaxID=29385 RepID=UPI0034C6A925